MNVFTHVIWFLWGDIWFLSHETEDQIATLATEADDVLKSSFLPPEYSDVLWDPRCQEKLEVCW